MAALPDALELIVKRPDAAGAVAPALLALAGGHPNAAAAIARTLDRLRRFVVFAPDAFAALARVYAGVGLDHAPGLVEHTDFDPRTLEEVLQQPPRTTAPREVRRRHARALANDLGSPRPEVRTRAARALGYYTDHLRAVWPALVAVLVGGDEQAARLVLPLFGHMKPFTDAVPIELAELFREPNPAHAARAVVARWHLGSLPPELSEQCRATLSDTSGEWNWAVLRDVPERMVRFYPAARFAAGADEVIAQVDALLCAPEQPDEAAISAHVRPGEVNWNGVSGCVENQPEGPLLFLALMSAFGADRFTHGPWLLVQHRGPASTRSGGAKAAVDGLAGTGTPAEKRACVRDYFGPAAAAPAPVADLLGHRLSWYRWAGLELLDAWDAPAHMTELIAHRVRDRSELVRRRAVRVRDRQEHLRCG